MKFSIHQKELLKAITTLSKSVATRTNIDILKGIFFKASNNELLMATNNLEVGMQTSLPCEVQEKGQLVIEAKVIIDIIRKMPQDIITFEVVTDNYIELKCQNTKFNIKYLKCEEFPMPEYIDENAYIDIDAQNFKSLIESTNYAVSKIDDKPLYINQYIALENNTMLMFALDGFRVSLMQKQISKENDKKKTFVVSGKIILDISSTIEQNVETVKLGYTDRHISIINGETVITSSLVVSQFLDYKSIIPQKFNTVIEIKIQELKNAIERVALISDSKIVALRTNCDKLSINTRNESVGQAVEVIDVEKEGPDIEIAFNASFLLDSLKHIDSEKIFIKLIDEVSSAVIVPEDNQDYINLVLPVMIN